MKSYKKLIIGLGILIALTPLGLITENPAWGEWSEEEMTAMLGFMPQGIKNGYWFRAPFGDYAFASLGDVAGYILSATLGSIIVISIFYALKKIARAQK